MMLMVTTCWLAMPHSPKYERSKRGSEKTRGASDLKQKGLRLLKDEEPSVRLGLL